MNIQLKIKISVWYGLFGHTCSTLYVIKKLKIMYIKHYFKNILYIQNTQRSLISLNRGTFPNYMANISVDKKRFQRDILKPQNIFFLTSSKLYIRFHTGKIKFYLLLR